MPISHELRVLLDFVQSHTLTKITINQLGIFCAADSGSPIKIGKNGLFVQDNNPLLFNESSVSFLNILGNN